MHIPQLSRRFRAFALIGALLPILACGDDSTGPGEQDAFLGTWQAASFVADGTNFIAQGMTLKATFAANNMYTFVVTNDLVGICGGEGGNNCTDTGPVGHTSTAVTLDADTDDETTFSYTINGNAMTWTGSIDGTAATLTWNRAN